MTPILPGSTIGLLGGGQLARMVALEARRMDYHVVVVDPARDCAASLVADEHLCGGFDEPGIQEALLRRADVITLDTEHVPVEALRRLERAVPVHPGSRQLEIVQDRLLQREALARGGFPQPQYVAVHDPASLAEGVARIGTSGVLKTRRHGYDGRGQRRVDSAASLDAAARELSTPAILEALVPFCSEISVVVARDALGRTETFPPAENVHRNHVLLFTVAPARVPAEVAEAATSLARGIADVLGVVGLCSVELFVLEDGQLLVNEVALRPHNSGHYTWGAASVSQFEQHVRAVCGLPLARPTLLTSAVMVNLLGDLWADHVPPWSRVLAMPGVSLHLYGKEPRPGRKMGHLLRLGAGEPEEVVREILDCVGETSWAGTRPP